MELSVKNDRKQHQIILQALKELNPEIDIVKEIKTTKANMSVTENEIEFMERVFEKVKKHNSKGNKSDIIDIAIKTMLNNKRREKKDERF